MKNIATLCLLIAVSAAAPLHAESLDELFQRVDNDGDNRLSEAEMKADAKTFFQNIDTNGDGQISYEEFYADNAKSFNETGHVPPADVLATITRQGIQRWDRNGDGQLSAEEYINGMVNDTFQFADTDGDGYLSREEMRAFRDEN